MRRSPRFLSVDDVILMHVDTLGHEGGLAGIRDQGLLESAVMMPRQQFGGLPLHRALADQAGAYLFHLYRNDPFNDGNKRAAVLAALIFLDANGVGDLPEPEPLEMLTMRRAAGEIGKDAVASFFRNHLRRVRRGVQGGRASSPRASGRGRRRGGDRRG